MHGLESFSITSRCRWQFLTRSNVLISNFFFSNDTIQWECEDLVNLAERPDMTDPQAFGIWLRGYYREENCIDMDYESDVEWYKEVDVDAYPVITGSRQWLYQTCSEFGWYQTSGSKYQPFGSLFPVDLYYRFCEDIFGLDREAVDAAAEKKNEKFGGFNPNVENVYFTHGQVDPWRSMGVQTTQSNLSPATVIQGASHCQDLNPLHPSDNSEMRAVKLRIKELIEEWITPKSTEQI